jgi:DinB superfamily
MSAVLDSFVLEHAPGPLVELDPALVRARSAFNGLLAALAAVTDDKLTCAWTWDANGVDVRYGFYRTLEILESATSAAGLAVAGSVSTEARDAVAAATASRWALQGILASLTATDLDADPGGGEWTVRQTMGHIIGGQRGYAWGSAWWLSTRDQPRSPGPQRAPDAPFAELPDDDAEAAGSLAVIRHSLDDVVDATSSRYSTMTTDDMQVKSGWSGFPVTIGFRQWRWSSHIVEHTIQIEKTLDMLGRRRSEVDWLVRSVARAFGQLEATVFGRSSAGTAAGVLDQVATAFTEIHPTLQAAVEAAVSAEEW